MDRRYKIQNASSARNLCRSAAESAGERRGLGTDHDLAWRFFGRHFFARCRRDTWWGIQQLSVLDQFFDLQAVECFVFEQCSGDGVEMVAIDNESLFRGLVSVVEQTP